MDNTVALNTLQGMVASGTVPPRDAGFVGSLVEQAAKRGLSDKQWYWVVTLAERFTAPPAPTKVVADFSRVYAMFATARAKLKYPKVHLALPDGEAVKLYVSGERSRVPNVVNVVASDTDTWYGRVYQDGRWEGGKGNPEATKAVEGLLTRLAADPEAVAKEYGRLTGACCFCSRTLTDERSTDVGYGPVCAKRFGLDWGRK